MFFKFKSIIDLGLWTIVVVRKLGFAALRVVMWWSVCVRPAVNRFLVFVRAF